MARILAKIKKYEKTVEIAFEQKIFSLETSKNVLPTGDFTTEDFLW